MTCSRQMDHYTPIRNGILEHLEQSRLSPLEFALYVMLHLRADWATGIYRGCALTLAYQFGNSHLHLQIKDTLLRLKRKGYINYSPEKGRRGAYEILIHKYEPRLGRLSGTRLNAWKHDDLAKPEYEALASGSPETRLRLAGDSPETRTIQEVRSRESKKSSGADVPLPDWMPVEAWTGFIEMRKRSRSTPTNRAVQLLVKKLDGFRAVGMDLVAILDQSTRNCWKDIFPVKREWSDRQNGKAETLPADYVSASERIARERAGGVN